MAGTGAILFVGLLVLASVGYLTWYFHWEAVRTRGMAYYGLPLDARRALKRRMRWCSLPARPLLAVLGLLLRRWSTMPAFEFDGVSGPPRVSSPDVFARARRYQPQREDVFVATQMRCGTTWMQQLVYQTVTRGRGGFGTEGRSHLYAISPWIDAVDSVSIDEAPIVGDRPTRIIKTHLPTSLCPYSPAAKYVYVARHPVSCFASIVEFSRSMAGPMLPPVATLVEWFCSDAMYWQPWPRHVEGWWQWADSRPNVLFVHFEDMVEDFEGVRRRLAAFLDCTTTPEEAERIAEKCSFAYMKAQEEYFEMAPPTMFSVVRSGFMTHGGRRRPDDLTPAIRQRIVAYCAGLLRGGTYPVGRFYPDLV